MRKTVLTSKTDNQRHQSIHLNEAEFSLAVAARGWSVDHDLNRIPTIPVFYITAVHQEHCSVNADL